MQISIIKISLNLISHIHACSSDCSSVPMLPFSFSAANPSSVLNYQLAHLFQSSINILSLFIRYMHHVARGLSLSSPGFLSHKTPQTNILPGYSPDPLNLKVQHAWSMQSQLVTETSVCFYNYVVTGSYFYLRGEL